MRYISHTHFNAKEMNKNVLKEIFEGHMCYASAMLERKPHFGKRGVGLLK